jgi:pilus assembly protein FimV
MAEDYNETPLPDDQNPEPGNGDSSENIPDWMKEAGWETSSGTFDESKPVFDDLDDDDDEIVPADIPAWLEEAAPEGFNQDPNATPAFEGLDVDEPFITTGDLVPPQSMEEAPAELDEPAKEPESSEKTNEESFDIPTWLENLELHEDSQETAVAWLENMPESLRATEEELEASRDYLSEEPEIIEEPVDELAWVDENDISPEQPEADIVDDEAALSEDLVASELVPESTEPNQLFEQDEIESVEQELPSWLKELGDDETEPATEEEVQPPPSDERLDESPVSQTEEIPDWLRSSEETDEPEAPDPTPEKTAVSPTQETEEPSDLPDWLGEFEEGAIDSEEDADTLDWLDSLASEQAAAEDLVIPEEEGPPEEPILEESLTSEFESVEETHADPIPEQPEIIHPDGVSPNDETLNAQVPEWLSKIEEDEKVEEHEPPTAEPSVSTADPEATQIEGEFESADSWLDQIGEKSPDTSQDGSIEPESDVIDWLDNLGDVQEDAPVEQVQEDQKRAEELSAVEPESTEYIEETDEVSADMDDLPDWLSEIREDEESLTLEDAIRQSDHNLNDEEVDFLTRLDEKEEEDSDWLSKLDQTDIQPEPESSPPGIDLDPVATDSSDGDDLQEPLASGGMLDRLKETSDFRSGDDVPQWLADIKEEEDPQETAVLWLQQFVNQGDSVDIKDEIKRYTDELDPGDVIPKWMEDLKHEEDPQTTAMLWLEKLSANRQSEQQAEPAQVEEEDSGWLADLEKEASQTIPEETTEEIQDFDSPDDGWLADLEIDEKLQTTDEEIPDWSESEEKTPETEPPWMKATSPLEGDFHTDELAGDEEKEVDIPEWLAGYAEGEQPTEDQATTEEEYTWLSATDTPTSPNAPLDLNSAAISQLENILGISHQIAKGIVSYREKNGPYRDFNDLKNVPEITDEQTIDILKPEVFISEPVLEEDPTILEPEPSPEPTLPPEPAPMPETAPMSEPPPPRSKSVKETAKPDNFEEILVTARARINDRLISDATDLYSTLVKKKKFLDEVIEDLQKASLDHPLEISIQKTLGDAFMQKDLLDEALEAYSKAEDLLS